MPIISNHKMNDFYQVLNSTQTEVSSEFSILINKQHRVFEGHFPGNPVVPGVISMMMVRQCAEKIIGRETRFATISQCKYLQAIIPDDKPLTIKVSIDELMTLKGEIVNTDNVSLMTIKGTLA